ncbi:hypothetical protein NVRI1_00502 [Chlamydia abortus]|uniref:hypothetical protein n=1 Tax=Chlamydia abortus TaxID=83555 RepID=UPI001CE51CEF|nr:hypothetical protein [Chlamydia abortus]CAG9046157.1 hypothetical protein NVRI1_00502 [Chlamydia abortus]
MNIQEHLKFYCPTMAQFGQNHKATLSKISKSSVVFVIIGIAVVAICLAVTSPAFVIVVSGAVLLGVLALVISGVLLWLGKGPRREPGSESITIESLHLEER